MKTGKIILVAAVVLMLIPAAAFSQKVNWDGQYHKGDFALEVGAGYGYHGAGWGLAVLPGAEMTIVDWKIGEVVPLAFGVAAKGFVEFVPAEGVGFGAGGFAAFHMGFKGLDIPEFLQNMEVYLGLGVGAMIVPWDTPSFGITIPGYSGLAYFFKENLAVYLEGIYWATWDVSGYGGGVLGLRWKK